MSRDQLVGLGGRERNAGFYRFVRLMVDFRKRHPSLGRSRSWREDVRWFGVHALKPPLADPRALALCLRGGSQGDDDPYVMANAADQSAVFSVQDASQVAWRRVVDTSEDTPADIIECFDNMPTVDSSYEVKGRSVVVLLRPRS